MSKDDNRPYQKENIDYIYSNEYDSLIIIPLGVIYDLLDRWDIIIKGLKEKLTFKQVRELAKNFPNLWEYCNSGGMWDAEEDMIFRFTDDDMYSMFNHNSIMEESIPNEIIGEFVTYDSTIFGDSLVVIDPEKETELIEYFMNKGWNIKKDNLLIDDALMRGVGIVE